MTLFGSFDFPCFFHNLIDVRNNHRLAYISGVQTFNFGFEVHCLRLGMISLAALLNTVVRLLIADSACFNPKPAIMSDCFSFCSTNSSYAV